MPVTLHQYNDGVIAQTSFPSLLGDSLIPKGYCNGSQMCKLGKKKLEKYLRLKDTIDYLEALALDADVTINRLVIESYTGKVKQVWLHPEVALDLAHWLSMPMRVWANKILAGRMTDENIGNLEKLAVEAYESKKWLDARNEGKMSRRAFTQAIDEYFRQKELSLMVKIQISSLLSNQINMAIFGKTARELADSRGCHTENLRDTHSAEELNLISLIESYAARLLSSRTAQMMTQYNPESALKEAISFYC